MVFLMKENFIDLLYLLAWYFLGAEAADAAAGQHDGRAGEQEPAPQRSCPSRQRRHRSVVPGICFTPRLGSVLAASKQTNVTDLES
jgi:hypothetical protein